jgi:selenocysteine lyase/cysteine desulfurase
MATLPLPDRLQPDGGGPPLPSADPPRGPLEIRVDPVQARLLEEHRIEIPLMHFGGRRFMRFSTHVYNEFSEYERLAVAVETM